MALIRIGPFSDSNFSVLKEKLEENKITFTLTEDPTLLDSYREQLKKHEEGRHPQRPTYSGIVPEYIFISLEKENLLIIKTELDKLGVAVLDRAQPESVEEYQCPKCGYYSEASGVCPKHQIQLITRTEWLQKKSEAGIGTRVFSLLFILAFLGFLIFAFTKK